MPVLVIIGGLAAAGGILWMLLPSRADAAPPPPAPPSGGPLEEAAEVLQREAEDLGDWLSGESGLQFRAGLWHGILDTYAALSVSLRSDGGYNPAALMDEIVYFYVGAGRSPFGPKGLWTGLGEWVGKRPPQPWIMRGRDWKERVIGTGRSVESLIAQGRESWFTRYYMGARGPHLPHGDMGGESARWRTRDSYQGAEVLPRPSVVMARFSGTSREGLLFPTELSAPDPVAAVDLVAELWGVPTRAEWAAFKMRHADEYGAALGVELAPVPTYETAPAPPAVPYPGRPAPERETPEGDMSEWTPVEGLEDDGTATAAETDHGAVFDTGRGLFG